MYKFVTGKNGGLSDGTASLVENEEELKGSLYFMDSTDEMADIDVQQHPVGLPRSVGSTTLNDTFDLQQNFQEETEVKDVSLTQDQDSEEDDEGDDWLIQEELAKLRAEWDDYVDNLDGELEMEDYPPIDMKERLRKINEEWGAEELVVRTNTKVNFSENLVTFEVPPPDHIDDNDSDLEIEYRVSQVMREDDDDDDEEEEMIGDGDKEDEEHEKEMDVGNDVQGEGDRHGDVSDMFAKQLTLSEQENKEEEELRTDLNEDSNKILITETLPEKVVEPESFNPEIENKENTESEVNIISETNPATEEKKQEEQVLIERDGKFELKKVSELSAEERNIMGLGSPSEKNRNASNEEGLASPSNGEDDISLEETPKKKERPSTAKTYQSIHRQPVQKRRIQSAKSTTYVTQENLQYDKPEGFSKYGLSPEQKELKKKQMMIKSQRLQDKRQREEEEKKRQQEEADSAFQAWVKRKQQETIERKKLERQQQKKTEVKIQKDPKEAEESYEAWLKAKKQQAKMERKVNKQKKKEEKEAYFYRSRNECDEAFKELQRSTFPLYTMAAQPEGDPNDASDMLAAALEQMDDIIAGTKLQSAELQNGLMESEQTHFTSPGYGDPTMIPKLAEDLRIAAERADEQGEGLIYRDQVPQWTKDFLSQWLQSNGALMMDDDVYQNPHDRVQRLESEKHSLHLQVNVLSEQVEIQTEKIQELEYALSDSDRKLFDTESRLQEERRMRRPSYDDIKRNESNELVQLQLRLSSAENEVALLRERTLQAESRLEEKEQDLYILEEKYEGLQRALKDVQDESRNWQEKYMESQSEMEQMHSSGPTRQQMNADRERYSQVIESLQTSNNEKDRIIEDMRRNFRKYKRIEEIFITAQGSKAELVQRLEEELARTDTGSTSSSVTVESESSSRMGGGREDGSLDYAHNSLPRELNGKHRSASMENLKPVDGLLETDIDLYPGGYRTLPSPKTKTSEPNSPVKGRNGSQRSGSFDKDNLQKGRKTSTSEPNLAVTETEDGFMEVHRRRQVTFDPKTDGLSDSSGTSSSDVRAKKGGIKKLIGKLRRSNSASLQDEDYDSPIEFHRGSRYRATAMPRLGWSQGLSSHGDTDAPFAKWDVDQVAGWMHEMGLGRYVAMCRVWIKNGTTLLQASPIELERNLSMRNPLHRKKLQLALQAIGSEQVDDPGQLDYNWVTRWLDDIGLPQYKDAFSEARIDGRMLHYLSVDDLLMLKVTSALHHASIMRGIQCLRLNKFHPHCLRRRPTDEPYENGTEVMLWTNHRVMDWLRSVDLSEYAPNLRGSGVHGGLMTLENRFTAETLATLLSIPASKTLLRRHLGTHFMSLCGHDIQHAKRIAEKSVGFMPLNVIGKVKPKKRSFGARKRRGMEDEDFLCPMEEPLPVPLTSVKPQITAANNNTQPQPGHGNYKVEVRSAERVHKQADEILLDGPEMEENTTTEIGAFSAELNTLTSKLEDDVHLNRSTHV